MNERYRLGILFVHGIGEQYKADVLLHATEPLVRWVRRALDSTVVRLTDARLGLTGPAQDEPAHAVVSIEPALEPEQKWLLAECWWAGEVRRPPFFRLAGWMLTTGAWMIVSHYLRRDYRESGALAAIRRIARLVLCALPLVLLSQLMVLLLTGLALIPLPRFRAVLSGALLALTGILGDTFVFVENKTQQAAIVAEARRRLEWLAERCDSVAVLAHSQGAAVAHRALRGASLDNVKVFITYGGAIAKIEEVEYISEHSPDQFRAAYLAIPAAALGIVAALRVAFAYANDDAAWLVVFWAGTAVLALAGVVHTAHGYRQVLEERIRRLAGGLRARWYDVYATADAVPNGPLGVPGVRSRRVVNRRSPLTDHTTYWENTSQFVPLVGRQILRAAGLAGPATELLDAAARRETRAHAARVAWLVRARWSAIAACVLAPIVLSDVLYGIGDTAINALEQVDIVSSRWIAILRSTGLAELVLGSAVPIGLIVGWHVAYGALWRSWDARSADRIFVEDPSPEPVLTAAAYASLGFGPLAVLALRWWQPSLFAADAIELRLYRLLGWAYVALVLLVVVVAAAQQARIVVALLLSRYREARQRAKQGETRAGRRPPRRAGRSTEKPSIAAARQAVASLAGLVAFAAVFVVLFAPGVVSATLRETALVAFMMMTVAAVLVRFHRRIAEPVRGPIGRALVSVVPVVLAVALAVFDWGGDRTVAERLTQGVGGYLLGLGVVKLGVKIASKLAGRESEVGSSSDVV